MLPADLDDEQRAHLAHEHPNDLDSSPSSPSSETPTFFESRRRSKPISRHRSNTATDGSSTSHLLARLVSREEDVREIKAALAVTSERLEAESSRANAAERRALDYFHRLRIATDNRERAEQESARLREELKLYKLQLENAQKEIFRAQDIIDQVASQRNEAEAEAARARTKARKLQEEKLVMLAREEGRRMGYREGLSMGRRIVYDEDHYDDDDDVLGFGEDNTDEERHDPRSDGQLRSGASIRQQPTRTESVPPVRTFETTLHAPPLPVPSRVVPGRIYTPSHEDRIPSPPREPDESETIHPIPIPIRPSPILSSQPISVPIDDGWIPRADSRTSYISMPPPYGLQRMPSPTSSAAELQDRRPASQPEPTPVPPPVRSRDNAYQPSAPPPFPRGHTPSIASRASTHISQCDLLRKRPGSSLRNEIYLGKERSGSQPSRKSTSRNEYRGQEYRDSNRTEAETMYEEWHGDSDPTSPPRNPPRSFTPAPIPHPHRPPNFYYRPQDVVTPTPPGDVDDPRSRTPIPTESTAVRPHAPSDDPTSNPARARSSLDPFRQRQRQRPGSGGSGTIPDIVVQSPSEPETTMSPATTAAQPELLSPEAANRPLPQDDAGQQQQQHPHRQHQHQHHQHQHSHTHSHPQYQSHPPSHHRHHPSSSRDAAPRSGTPYPPWPAGFVPYPSGYGTASSSTSHSRLGPEKDHRRAYSNPGPGADLGLSQSAHVRTRTQGAPTSMGRGGAYEAAPVPPGLTYPAPPGRPHTSHQRHGDRDRDREREWNRDRDWDRDRDRDRDRVRERDRDRERARDVRDRDWDWERRRDPARDYQRERGREREGALDVEDAGFDEELTRSPAPLQRPISLFDSDE